VHIHGRFIRGVGICGVLVAVRAQKTSLEEEMFMKERGAVFAVRVW